MADQNNMQTPPPASGGVDNDKLMGILSYIGILVLIPLLATSNRSSFLSYHVNQGLNLLIVWIILLIILNNGRFLVFVGEKKLKKSLSLIKKIIDWKKYYKIFYDYRL